MSERNVTILLVEDNDIDIMGVQRAFKASNAINSIVVAGDGLEALALLRDGKSVPRPYLVLLDLNMPKMNGIEFLAAARQDPELRNSIVFVLSTSRADDDKNQAFGHNIAGYIVKDRTAGDFINAAELLERYARVCEIP